jgi:hypothetical protein
MSLAIILDKSSFQMLNLDEIVVLHNYFLPNITPILVTEILGDVKKEEVEGKSSKEKVAQLAKKLLPYQSEVNIHYPKLIEMNLLGDKLSLDHRPIVGNITLTETETGAKGFHHGPSHEEVALSQWKNGKFSKTEELEAKLWRDVTTQQDILTNLQQQLKEANVDGGKLRSLEEVQEYVDSILADPKNQKGLLEFCFTEFGINAELTVQIYDRWLHIGEQPTLATFAPYAYHCCRVKLFFYLALKNDLIGTRPTNNVDLQYLYYLPFCLIFSSNDKFHKNVVRVLMGDRHTFVTGDELKKGLKEVVSYRSVLSEKKHIERTQKEPPEIPAFLTYQLWNKYLNWPSKFNWKISATEMEEQKIKMETFINAKAANKSEGGVVDDPDFIVKETFMSPDDLCPCGSGKKLIDCHAKGYMPRSDG